MTLPSEHSNTDQFPFLEEETADTLPKLIDDLVDNTPRSFNRLGAAYAGGHFGLPIKPDKAFTYFNRAAEAKDPKALYNVGQCSLIGFGTRKNLPHAFSCFKQAAQAGDPLSCMAVASCYAQGTGTTPNQTLATEWFLTAAHLGHIEAYIVMAERYKTGLGVDRPDPLQSMLLLALAAKTDPDPNRKSQWEHLYFQTLITCCNTTLPTPQDDSVIDPLYKHLVQTLYPQASESVDTHIIPPAAEKDRKNWQLDITGQGLKASNPPFFQYKLLA